MPYRFLRHVGGVIYSTSSSVNDTAGRTTAINSTRTSCPQILYKNIARSQVPPESRNIGYLYL